MDECMCINMRQWPDITQTCPNFNVRMGHGWVLYHKANYGWWLNDKPSGHHCGWWKVSLEFRCHLFETMMYLVTSFALNWEFPCSQFEETCPLVSSITKIIYKSKPSVSTHVGFISNPISLLFWPVCDAVQLVLTRCWQMSHRRMVSTLVNAVSKIISTAEFINSKQRSGSRNSNWNSLNSHPHPHPHPSLFLQMLLNSLRPSDAYMRR